MSPSPADHGGVRSRQARTPETSEATTGTTPSSTNAGKREAERRGQPHPDAARTASPRCDAGRQVVGDEGQRVGERAPESGGRATAAASGSSGASAATAAHAVAHGPAPSRSWATT